MKGRNSSTLLFLHFQRFCLPLTPISLHFSIFFSIPLGIHRFSSNARTQFEYSTCLVLVTSECRRRNGINMCVDIGEADDHGTKASMSESGIRESTGISAFQSRRTSIISMEIENWLVDWQNIYIGAVGSSSPILIVWFCHLVHENSYPRRLIVWRFNWHSLFVRWLYCEQTERSEQCCVFHLPLDKFHNKVKVLVTQCVQLTCINSSDIDQIILQYSHPPHVCVCSLTSFIH